VIEVRAFLYEDAVVEGALDAVGTLLGERVVAATLTESALDRPADAPAGASAVKAI
jgi:hypothetical protein